MSLLVVMGSGETAPTMIKIHREILAASHVPAGPAAAATGLAVMLDTPFAFQMNADDLVARTQAYFAEAVGTSVEVASWRRADAPLVAQETALARLHQARWAFAGPGSPTYALRQWAGTALPDALLDVAERGGTLVFGSAAACTLGTHAIPVYEIYKVGEEPRWAVGLDLMGRLTGIHAVVIPHYDNSEGGGHDTRFCYLGEQRLSLLETSLPDEVGVLGVDEHTALILDTDARTATVKGNGVVSVRRRGATTCVPAGSTLAFDALMAMLRGQSAAAGAIPQLSPAGSSGPAAPPATPESPPVSGGQARPSLRADADAARARFDDALAARDVDAAVAAVLELEGAIQAWQADTLQSDDTDHARRVLRALIVRLADVAKQGARDPRSVVSPFVELLLDLRSRARATKDYATSDLVRDGLVAAGIEVRDTPDGVQWGVGSAG